MKRLPATLFLVFLGLAALALCIRSCIQAAANAPGTAIEGLSREGSKSVRQAADLFVDLFHLRPEIRVSNRVVQEQTAEIAEFAVVEREFQHHYVWQHRWLGSEKSIVIEGAFKAKAGFDLHEPFVIQYNAATGKVLASLPPARILSIEQVGDLHFHDEDGFWNRVRPEDREQALNDFERTAHEMVQNSDLVHQAEQQAVQRLQELADRNQTPVLFYFEKTQ